MQEVTFTFRVGFKRFDELSRQEYPYMSKKERTKTYDKDLYVFTKTVLTDKPQATLAQLTKEAIEGFRLLCKEVEELSVSLQAGEKLVESSFQS